MSYKTIVVHVDSDKRSSSRVEMATGLALSFGAHLIGMHLVAPPRMPNYAQAELGADFIANMRRQQSGQSDELRRDFDNTMRRHGLVGSEWRAPFGEPELNAALSARYADLVVVGQHDPDEERSSVIPDFAEHLVLSCGRPILVHPYAGDFSAPFKRVLVCWKPTREAIRAVTDAMPFLQRAEKVSILSVNPKSTPFGYSDVPGADLALFLSRHKVNAEVVAQNAVQIDVGAFILSHAADLSANLIVMGAYGHTRMREVVFGGVTRTLSRHMTVPVLFSH